MYRGENVAEHFLRSLLDEDKRIKANLNDPEPLSMSAEDEQMFQLSTYCHVCGEKFSETSVRAGYIS